LFDQLVIGNKSSHDDFEATVRDRVIKEPKKKVIKETVPFSNVTYDFSKMDGEFYWEERELEYNLEIIAFSIEEIEEKKLALKNWLMNVQEEELFDPFIKDYHFIATFDDISFDDSEFEKTTVTVTFTAYPYMIANEPTVYNFELTANETKTIEIVNDSSHRLTPTFTNDVPVTIRRDSMSYTIPTGETTDDTFKLSEGVNTLTVQSTSKGTLKISFYTEVL
jgi:hypothetical protein